LAGAWFYIRGFGDLPLWINIHDFLSSTVIFYLGKQAATWAMLSSVFENGYTRDDNNDGVIDYEDGRKSKIKNIVDSLAETFGISITSPRYALVWAFVKGAIMTLPIGLGLIGGVFHAIGHYLGFKFFVNMPYANAYKEFIGSGLCISVVITVFYMFKLLL